MAFFITVVLSSLSPVDSSVMEDIQYYLGKSKFDSAPLLKLGDTALPYFGVLLDDKSTKSKIVCRVFIILEEMQSQKKYRYIDITIRCLLHEDEAVRSHALRFLRRVGSERDTAPVVALLLDPDDGVRAGAAMCLKAIGGRRDVVAMDLWLRSGHWHDSKEHRQHVQKCRDELVKRLEESDKNKNDLKAKSADKR